MIRSIRIPDDLMLLLRAEASAVNRSVNWLIVEKVRVGVVHSGYRLEHSVRCKCGMCVGKGK